MSRWLRTVLAAAVLAVPAACGDDDAGGESDATGEAAAETTAGDDSAAGEDGAADEPPESSVPDGVAEDPPEGAGEDEGLGDPVVLLADLVGDAQVPGAGDDGGKGRFEAESAVAGEFCIDMVVTGLDGAVTGAHVHEGAVGQSGGIEVTIGPPTSTDGDTDTWTDVCVSVDEELAEDFVTSTDAFYVDVHTETHPDGAVRGQLVFGTIFDLTLS